QRTIDARVVERRGHRGVGVHSPGARPGPVAGAAPAHERGARCGGRGQRDRRADGYRRAAGGAAGDTGRVVDTESAAVGTATPAPLSTRVVVSPLATKFTLPAKVPAVVGRNRTTT